MELRKITKKTKLAIKRTELKIKTLDKKIVTLNEELYKNPSSLQTLKKQNVKLTGCMQNMNAAHADIYFYPDIFSYFRSMQDMLNQNKYFGKIIEVLKNEIYVKPAVLLNEDVLLQSITLPEKALYSQWILQTLTKKLSKRVDGKYDFDASLGAFLYLEKIMACCNMPVEDPYPATLRILNNSSFKTLSDSEQHNSEQDLLIFMHLTARMQNIFEMMKAIDFKHDNSQLLSSKVKRFTIHKRYLELLYMLKQLLDAVENIDLSKIFHAITNPKDIHRKTEDISEAFKTFKDYLTYTSGQINGILESAQVIKTPLKSGIATSEKILDLGGCTVPHYCKLQKLRAEISKSVLQTFNLEKLRCLRHEILDQVKTEISSEDNACLELAFKIQQYVDQGTEKFSENFGLTLLYEEFDEDVKNLICDIKTFIKEMSNMSINDINECRKLLNCLKTQIKFVLRSKWNLQKQLQPVICMDEKESHLFGETNVLSTVGRSQLLFEFMKDTMFYLKILEEIEFNKHFSVMSRLCELRERKDVLIEKFRNYIIRIGHQMMKQIPTIKKNLLELNKETQILFADYQKLRLQLQFMNPLEERNVTNLFQDIETVIMADFKASKEKRSVGMSIKRLNIVESEAAQKRTKDNVEEIRKIVDETMEFLHSLDETIISKEFSAMRYLCELHSIKEQTLSSFEILLDSMFKLQIEDDELIIHRLNQLKTAADGLIRNYETVGMQLMLFSDIMTMMNAEKIKTAEAENISLKESIMNISELFGPTEDVKKLHSNLEAAVMHKWFPAKTHLYDLLKDKERAIQAFENFLDHLPELDISNTLDGMFSLRELIINAENVLRRYQSLRIQLIWIAEDYVFNIKQI